ncbi:hypothetical protein N7495_004343 [Penicillium taxi]|uniref:uncharacterized protein n=1 Tax=Penicillium taxi TaxID=168475 RepID=UPI002545AC14|nr:uncharacterized protein N7495_004343 [Penicillium taxi]KAJ5899599.1 hypothetical protein N7495_004343 [Penicillium taxi]
MSINPSSEVTLAIRQQPNRVLVAGDKTKPKRKSIDPPPIIQLCVQEPGSYLAQHYTQSPYYFMCCSLHYAKEDAPVLISQLKVLEGALTSSIHHLKDVNNNDGGFFVFGDLSVKILGEFRLKFTLFEIKSNQAICLNSIISDIFMVYPPKIFPGPMESTLLSRWFAEQGVKLRISKKSRNTIGSSYRGPLQRQVPTANASIAYPSVSQNYLHYVQRQRTPPVGRLLNISSHQNMPTYSSIGSYYTIATSTINTNK